MKAEHSNLLSRRGNPPSTPRRGNPPSTPRRGSQPSSARGKDDRRQLLGSEDFPFLNGNPVKTTQRLTVWDPERKQGNGSSSTESTRLPQGAGGFFADLASAHDCLLEEGADGFGAECEESLLERQPSGERDLLSQAAGQRCLEGESSSFPMVAGPADDSSPVLQLWTPVTSPPKIEDALQSENAKLHEALRQFTADKARLEYKVEELERQISFYEARVAELESDSVEKTTTLSEQNGLRYELESARRDIERQKEQFVMSERHTKEEHESRVRELSSQLSGKVREKDKLIQSLRDQLRNEKIEVKRLQELRVGMLQKHADEIEKNRREVERDKEILLARLTSSESTNKLLRQELGVLRSEADKQAEKEKAGLRLLGELQAENAQLQAENEQLKAVRELGQLQDRSRQQQSSTAIEPRRGSLHATARPNAAPLGRGRGTIVQNRPAPLALRHSDRPSQDILIQKVKGSITGCQSDRQLQDALNRLDENSSAIKIELNEQNLEEIFGSKKLSEQINMKSVIKPLVQKKYIGVCTYEELFELKRNSTVLKDIFQLSVSAEKSVLSR